MKIKLIVVIIFIVILSSGCTQLNRLKNKIMPAKKEIGCADTRVDQAFELYDKAKMRLAMFYDDRDANHLFESYYASLDAVRVARSIKNCNDKSTTHFYAYKNLNSLSRMLQMVIRENLPDEDKGILIAIYREQYHKLKVRDIQ